MHRYTTFYFIYFQIKNFFYLCVINILQISFYTSKSLKQKQVCINLFLLINQNIDILVKLSRFIGSMKKILLQ